MIPAAGCADDGQKAVDRLAFRSRVHFAQKPLNQSFASEEKGSIVQIENAQTPVRTLAFINRLSGTCSGLHATNAA